MSFKTDRSRIDSPSAENDASERDKTIIIGIPAYKDGITTGSAVSQSRHHANDAIVADDGSFDGTVTTIEESGEAVIKDGKCQTGRQAVRTLLGHVQCIDLDAFVLLDGDGQRLPSDIPCFAAPVINERSDIEVGSRYVTNERAETLVHRRVGRRVLYLLTLGSSGTNLPDTRSGFRTPAPSAVSKRNVPTDGVGLESGMIASSCEEESTVEEISIGVSHEDVDGRTHRSLRHRLTVAAFVPQPVRGRYPLVSCGVPAAIPFPLTEIDLIHGAHPDRGTDVFYQWRDLVGRFVGLVGTTGSFRGLVLRRIQNMLRDTDE